MFDNIGGKIKILAQIFVWIGIIASVILGFILCTTDVEWLGVICVFIGPLLCWISSMTLYGFGELIEKTCKIEKILSNEKEVIKTTKTKDKEISYIQKESPKLHTCELCEKETNTLFTISLHGEDTDVCQECFATYLNADEN
jgi:hypothetical protein